MSKKNARVSAPAAGKQKTAKLSAIEKMAARGMSLWNIDASEFFKLVGETGEINFFDPRHRRPLDAVKEDIAAFDLLFDQGMARWKLEGNPDELSLKIAVGKRGMSKGLLLSNKIIRQKASEILINAVGSYYKETRLTPYRRWWFITFIGDSGNALEYEPVVNIPAFRAKIYKMLRQVNLDALCAIEVQTITNFPQGGDGRTFMFHAHAIAWSDDPDFDPEKVEKKLCASTRLRHWLGAKTVRITPIPSEYRHIVWRARYMLKAPVTGKFIDRSDDTPSGWKLSGCSIRPDLAVRLMECFTQLEFTEMVFGVGEGTVVAGRWRSKLNHWHGNYKRLGPRLELNFDLGKLWSRLRQKKGDWRRKPFHFIRKGSSPVPSAWEQAAELWLSKQSATRRWGKRTG